MNYVVFLALVATLGTWFVTALGAATVAFFKSGYSIVKLRRFALLPTILIAVLPLGKVTFWLVCSPD